MQHEEGVFAISSYPLRVVKLSRLAAQTLQYCASEHTSEELACAIKLSPQKARALCEQLLRKDLLEVGQALPPTKWPKVSIIIPSYNRAAQLERCLRSLYALDYPQEHLEMLVVDDASTDETASMLDKFMHEQAIQLNPVRVVTHATRQGVAISRNMGAEAAKYGLLAYIDSDCIASPGWLAELIPALQDTRIAAVGGMIRSYDTISTLGRYEDVRSSLFMGVRPQQVRLEGPLTYLPTANIVARREAWQHVGGFAPLTFGEDVDFCRRLLTNNFQIRYLPQGTVYHDYRTQPVAFLNIRASYASAEAALLRRHPTERRILLLPPEQATFAGLAVVGLWGLLIGLLRIVLHMKDRRTTRGAHPSHAHKRGRATTRAHPTSSPPRSPLRYTNSRALRARLSRHMVGAGEVAEWGGDPRGRPSRLLFMLPIALLLTLIGAIKRHRHISKQRMPINPFTTYWATLRSNMAYTYHLCRHLTRYYTLLLMVIGLLLPPLLLLVLILCGIVIGVDYARLRPAMGFGHYALCSLLDDCAYEVGVVRGCIKHRTWKPLVPVVKKRI